MIRLSQFFVIGRLLQKHPKELLSVYSAKIIAKIVILCAKKCADENEWLNVFINNECIIRENIHINDVSMKSIEDV